MICPRCWNNPSWHLQQFSLLNDVMSVAKLRFLSAVGHYTSKGYFVASLNGYFPLELLGFLCSVTTKTDSQGLGWHDTHDAQAICYIMCWEMGISFSPCKVELNKHTLLSHFCTIWSFSSLENSTCTFSIFKAHFLICFCLFPVVYAHPVKGEKRHLFSRKC